ncbi:MAG: hypothetical protein LBL59_01825 [Xanthomonadaceae bacterium]|jgi:hypothetical protein|nr:hypothetical protein [Xanthomonadaceae bacterium]
MRENLIQGLRCGALAWCLVFGAGVPAWAQSAAATPAVDPAFATLGRMVAAINSDPGLQSLYRQWFERQSEALRTQARSLAAQGGARNLLVAATLNDLPERSSWFDAAATTPSAQSRQWREAALSVRPRDRLASWVEAIHCGTNAGGCDRTAAIMFLLQSEPDNAAVHLLALDEAGRRGDGAAMRQYLRMAGQATRYDTHAQEWLQLMERTIRSSANATLDPALALAIERTTGSSAATVADGAGATFLTHLVMTTVLTPPLDWLMSICSAHDLDEQGRDDCIRTMDLLAHDGKTVVEQFSGTIGLVRLSITDADSRAWRDWLRQISWINERAGQLIPVSMIDNPMSYGAFLRWIVEQGEFAAYSELMARSGVDMSPPGEWLPNNPRQRALITSGSDEGFSR